MGGKRGSGIRARQVGFKEHQAIDGRWWWIGVLAEAGRKGREYRRDSCLSK